MRYRSKQTLLPTFVATLSSFEIYDFDRIYMEHNVKKWQCKKKHQHSQRSKFIARIHVELLSLEFEHNL